MSKPIITLKRLRLALVAGAVLLLTVVGGFIGYAHYLKARLQVKIDKLPFHVTEDSDGYTFSNSDRAKTKFTVHAAKQIIHDDGTWTLRDVGIVIYGEKGDRVDHIHGNEFRYDPKNGVVTAVGEAFIDLAPPQTAPDKNAGEGKASPKAGAKADDESRMVHLKTDGLVFYEKEELARTDSPVEFRVEGMNGTAVGASYDSVNGIIDLRSQVRVNGLRGKPGGAAGSERPMVLTASHAEIDLEDGDAPGNVAFLDAAKLVQATDNGTQTGSADHAVVHMFTDGTPKHVDANGNVTMTGEGRGTVTSDKLSLDLTIGGQPSAAHLMGVVRFVNDLDQKYEYGKANDVRIAFDDQGNPVHATMTGEVEAGLTAGTNTRWLGGDKVELVLGGGGKEPVVVREAQATANGGARMRLVDVAPHKDPRGKMASGVTTTNVRADLLDTHFLTNTKQPQMETLDGTGRTTVERTLADSYPGGTSASQEWRETGTGDVLKLDFKPDAKGQSQMTRAEQRGSVKIVREAAPKPKPDAASARDKAKTAAAGPEIRHAEGDVAVYEADSDRMTLTGVVKVSDAESALFAERATFDRGSGDANAEGDVRVSYLQQGSTGEPVHVLAARAIGHKASGITEFFSGGGREARMWQGGSSVEAPELDFDQTKKTLVAHGVKGAEVQAVKTVLVQEDNNKPPKPGAKTRGNNAPVRVWSRELIYTDRTREALFRGLVRVDDQDGTMRAKDATVYLAAKDEPAHPTSFDGAERDGAPGSSGMSLGGRVDHMIAVGAVEIEQPGKKATGERLVYTASDRMFVLTGTKSVPPKMVDDVQGTVTGASLRFMSGDDSVEVLSGDGSERVRTVTRLKQKD